MLALVEIVIDRMEELRGTPAAIVLVAIAMIAIALFVWVVISRRRGRALAIIAIGLGLPFSLLIVRSIFHSEVFIAQGRGKAFCITFSAGVVGVGIDPDLADGTGNVALHWLSRSHDGPHFAWYQVGTFPSVWRMTGRVDHYVEASTPLLLVIVLAGWRLWGFYRRKRVGVRGFEVRQPPSGDA